MDATGGLGKAARDFIVLCLLLAVANYLLDRANPGWLSLNPTPWLIPSVLIGIRYGFIAGLFTGLVTSAGVAMAEARTAGMTIPEVLHLHSYHFMALVIAGAVAGEAGSILDNSRRTLTRDSARLREENLRLRSQLHVVDETRHQLQQQLALFNAPLSTLDEELARIFAQPQEAFGTQLLHTLHRTTGLTSAAIYLVTGPSLRQLASIHPTPPLAELLLLAETPLAERALMAQTLASVPDATALTEAQPFLVAFPWVDPAGRSCVLLIQDMPLESYTLQNLARVELVISWASALAALRQDFARHAEKDREVSHQDFYTLLSEAVNADETHHLPSVVLRVQPPASGKLPRKSDLLPATAITTRFAGDPAFAILLPFSGHAEAVNLTRTISQAIPGARTTHYTVSGEGSSEALWHLLQQPS